MRTFFFLLLQRCIRIFLVLVLVLLLTSHYYDDLRWHDGYGTIGIFSVSVVEGYYAIRPTTIHHHPKQARRNMSIVQQQQPRRFFTMDKNDNNHRDNHGFVDDPYGMMLFCGCRMFGTTASVGSSRNRWMIRKQQCSSVRLQTTNDDVHNDNGYEDRVDDYQYKNTKDDDDRQQVNGNSGLLIVGLGRVGQRVVQECRRRRHHHRRVQQQQQQPSQLFASIVGTVRRRQPDDCTLIKNYDNNNSSINTTRSKDVGVGVGEMEKKKDDRDLEIDNDDNTTVDRILYDDIGAIRALLSNRQDDDGEDPEQEGFVVDKDSDSKKQPPYVSHILFTIPGPIDDPDNDPTIAEIVRQVFTDYTNNDKDNDNPDEYHQQHSSQNQKRRQRRRRWIGIISTTGVYGDHGTNVWVNEKSECRCEANSTAGRLLRFEEYWKSKVVTPQSNEGGNDKDDRKANDEKSNTPNGDNSTRRRRHRQYPPPVVVRIFRCAGIYGGGKSALHTVYRNGMPPDIVDDNTATADEDGITNRIHVGDIASAIVASMQQFVNNNNNGHNQAYEGDDEPVYRVYNLADNLPESRNVVLQYAAQLLTDQMNITLPTKTMTLSTSSSSKRQVDSAWSSSSSPRPSATSLVTRSQRRKTERKLVNNERMRKELLASYSPSPADDDGHDASCRENGGLKYPTYKEGLQSILCDKTNPWWTG